MSTRTATAPTKARKAPARKPAAKGKKPDLRVVRQAPTRRSLGLLGSLVFIVIFGSLLTLAVLHTLIVQGQNRLDDLNDRAAEATERGQQLQLEVARLESPDRILAEAEGRLGMVPPPARVYLEAPVLGDPEDAVPPPSANPFGTGES